MITLGLELVNRWKVMGIAKSYDVERDSAEELDERQTYFYELFPKLDAH